MKEHIELRKISHESFYKKKEIFRNKYKNKKKILRTLYKGDIEKVRSKQEAYNVKIKYKRSLKRASNKYYVAMKSLEAQRLYRRGVLEQKSEKAIKNYKHSIKSNPLFNKKEEKRKLNKKLLKLKEKYSKPLARSYRKNRTQGEKGNFDFISLKLPTYTPFKNISKTVLLIILASLFTTFGLDVFIKVFGLYTPGMRGITQLFFYIIQFYDENAPDYYSYLLFFTANIPLAIWAWFKLSKTFTIYTIIFLGMQVLTSMAFSWSGLKDGIHVFGDSPIEIRKALNDNTAGDLVRYVYIFIATLLGSIFFGVGVGLIYKAGGSTRGTKFIVTYIAAKRNVSVGFIANIVGIFVVFMGISVNQVMIRDVKPISAYTSAILFGSIMFSFVSNLTLDRVHNRNKKIQLDLLTIEKGKILYFLDVYLMYDKRYVIEKSKMGYNQSKGHKFEFILTSSEAKLFKKYFRAIDNEALIIEKPIDKVYGKFYSSWFK